MNCKIYNNDCLTQLDELKENSIDSIITDPPYELNFMGKGWDNAGVSFNKETWQKCLRVLKPGGYLLAFGGSRTFHRIACAIEDAGFEIRDTIMWIYGSGFPKSMNIGLAIDKKNGVESKVIGERKQTGAKFKLTQELIDNGGFNDPNRESFTIKEAQNEWKGWGTQLKPSFEPIIVARKPFKGSLVDNVIKWGVGGLNIDECRVGTTGATKRSCQAEYPKKENGTEDRSGHWARTGHEVIEINAGRFPANTILTYDETDFDEVCGGFPQNQKPAGNKKAVNYDNKDYDNSSYKINYTHNPKIAGDNGGSASRYFYCAKASKKDRDEGLGEEFEKKQNIFMATCNGTGGIQKGMERFATQPKANFHPTVKPTELMQYLVRLVTPKGGTIIDPFMGSGSTGKAVMFENKERKADYNFIGIEKEKEYCNIAEARIRWAEEYKEEKENENQISFEDLEAKDEI